MTQASQAPTTNLPSFSSLTARHPQRTRPAPTELQTALTVLKAHVRSLQQPYEPRFEAEAVHIEEWADHLDEVLGAAFTYARAVTSHLGDVTPAGLTDEISGLADAISDVVGALRKAASRVAEAAALAA
jgi:hypothetical protein